MYVVKFI